MTFAAQCVFEILEPAIVARIDDHMRTGARKRARHRAAQMTGCGRDERDAAVETKHRLRRVLRSNPGWRPADPWESLRPLMPARLGIRG